MTHASHPYTRPATGQPPHHPHRNITPLITASLPSPCVTTPSHRPSTRIHPSSTMRVKNARTPLGRPKSGSHAGKLRSFARGTNCDLQVTLLSSLFWPTLCLRPNKEVFLARWNDRAIRFAWNVIVHFKYTLFFFNANVNTMTLC